MISLLLSIWRRIIGSYLLWNSFFGLTVICPFISEIPKSDQQDQYQQIKAKCGFILKLYIYAMSVCLLKPACLFLFCFCFGLVWCVLLFIWKVGGWVLLFILMSDLWWVFLSFYNRHIHVNTKHVKFKQETKVPRRSPEKKKANAVSSVDYQIQNI